MLQTIAFPVIIAPYMSQCGTVVVWSTVSLCFIRLAMGHPVVVVAGVLLEDAASRIVRVEAD